jgi:hypothetical protein
MDGMPEHLFESNENDTVSQETFEMINFKHKQQKRDLCAVNEAENIPDVLEKKPETGSYLSKLNSFA